jgi:lipopolysaccharide biosynthesis glycosyltransferase
MYNPLKVNTILQTRESSILRFDHSMLYIFIFVGSYIKMFRFTQHRQRLGMLDSVVNKHMKRSNLLVSPTACTVKQDHDIFVNMKLSEPPVLTAPSQWLPKIGKLVIIYDHEHEDYANIIQLSLKGRGLLVHTQLWDNTLPKSHSLVIMAEKFLNKMPSYVMNQTYQCVVFWPSTCRLPSNLPDWLQRVRFIFVEHHDDWMRLNPSLKVKCKQLQPKTYSLTHLLSQLSPAIVEPQYSEPINVVLMGDSHVYDGIAVAINSILYYSKHLDLLQIYVLSDNAAVIASIKDNLIPSFLSKIDTILNVIVVDETTIQNVRSKASFMSYANKQTNLVSVSNGQTFAVPVSPFNFMRLFLPDLLPANVDKMLYIDTDMVVKCDVAEILQLVPNEYDHAGVYSDVPYRLLLKNWILNPALVQEYNVQYDRLWNGGLFVTHLRRWNDNKITEKAIQLMTRNKMQKIYNGGTQVVQNLVFQNCVGLPQVYNQTGLGEPLSVGQLIMEKNVISAKVLHWTGESKPWQQSSILNGFAEDWFLFKKNSSSLFTSAIRDRHARKQNKLVQSKIEKYAGLYTQIWTTLE